MKQKRPQDFHPAAFEDCLLDRYDYTTEILKAPQVPGSTCHTGSRRLQPIISGR